ncbi:hypothetical protein J1N35_018791 [Gossypium stocksii]|uniref:Uncharacterized protein n=1 Tax=Gossypium stocksii TaxID=47602 RepID=A0A9D3VQ97_9ROSI|nr:hypothetical protein J1N35_018791 [Gossypium stocksii]
MDMFDELVESAKVVDETLVEPPHSVVTKSIKRTCDGASDQQPKRGRDNHSSGRVRDVGLDRVSLGSRVVL